MTNEVILRLGPVAAEDIPVLTLTRERTWTSHTQAVDQPAAKLAQSPAARS